MDVAIAIITLALVGLVVVVVGAPLRRARRLGDAAPQARGLGEPSETASGAPARGHGDERQAVREELEAAREAKYREIRDTELDYRTGKLSQEDYQAIDADLRVEALEILDRLERLSSTDA